MVPTMAPDAIAEALWEDLEEKCPDEYLATVQDARRHQLDIISILHQYAQSDFDLLMELVCGSWKDVVWRFAEHIPEGMLPTRDRLFCRYIFHPKMHEQIYARRQAQIFVNRWQAASGRGDRMTVDAAKCFLRERDYEYALTDGEAGFVLDQLNWLHYFWTAETVGAEGDIWSICLVRKHGKSMYELRRLSGP
jgi:hypothetical protein